MLTAAPDLTCQPSTLPNLSEPPLCPYCGISDLCFDAGEVGQEATRTFIFYKYPAPGVNKLVEEEQEKWATGQLIPMNVVPFWETARCDSCGVSLDPPNTIKERAANALTEFLEEERAE